MTDLTPTPAGSSRERRSRWLSLCAGLLFGAGLVLSGMTQPQKVLNFLDIFGEFDASLMFVMVGAIGVHTLAYRWIQRRSTPRFGPRFVLPTEGDVDAKLLLGALLFGAGWGLGGYCPGPALVSLPGGGLAALTFVAAMGAGMFCTAKLEALWTRPTPPPTAAADLRPSAGAQ